MDKYGLIDKIGLENMCDNVDEALDKAASIVGTHVHKPEVTAPEVKRKQP
jgi:hypothetical protein